MVMPAWLVVTAIVSLIIIGLLLVVQLFAMTTLLYTVKKLIDEIHERIDPLIAKTSTLLTTTNELVESVQQRAEHIAEKTAQTTDVVSDRVERTSGLVQGVVTTPIIKGAALWQGLRKTVRAWRDIRAQRQRTPAPVPPTTPPMSETPVTDAVTPFQGPAETYRAI